MKEFTYTVTDENGIHARPAGGLVKLAKTFQSRITVEAGGKSADVKKLFNLMGLGVKKGNIVKVVVEGIDEEKAVDQLEQYFKENI